VRDIIKRLAERQQALFARLQLIRKNKTRISRSLTNFKGQGKIIDGKIMPSAQNPTGGN